MTVHTLLCFYRRITPALVCAALVATLLPLSTFAQTVHEVSPRAIEHTVQPGDIITETITVTNTYPYLINVFPSVHGLVPGTAGEPGRIIDTDDTPITRWINMTRAAQRLPSGVSTTVDVRITIPRNVSPGTYHGLLGFGQGIDRPTAESAVVRGSAPAVVLRFAVPEPDVDTATAAQLSLHRFILSPQQAGLFYTVHNPSARAVVPSGEILFFNNRGVEVASVPINQSGAAVAPGESLQVATSTPAFALLGAYEARARVNFGNSQLATVAVTDAFWYTPWYILLGLLIGIMVVSWILYRRLRRHTAPEADVVTGATALPLHVYQGESPAETHDLNLKR